MTTTEDRVRVDVDDRIARSPREVFDAIVDPKQMAQYFISGASGPMTAGATIEWRWSDVDAKLNVDVTSVDPGTRVVFDWPATGVRTTVTITLVPDGDQTKISITEAGWALDRAGVSHALGQTRGWTDFCCCLKAYLQHGINLRLGRPAEHLG